MLKAMAVLPFELLQSCVPALRAELGIERWKCTEAVLILSDRSSGGSSDKSMGRDAIRQRLENGRYAADYATEEFNFSES